MACALIALVSIAGCEKQAAKVPSIPALPPNDTPEGKLARIMQRLDSALETAQAASGSGVISERRAFHKLLPPQGASDAYEAIIYIETKRALAPMALNAAAQAKLEAKTEKAEKEGEEPSDKPRKPLVVEETEQVEVKEYLLVYDGQRWKLAKELEPAAENEPQSTEEILFDYALGPN